MFFRRIRRVPLDKLDVRRLCIIKPSALGDIIHALPVLTALRRRFPSASISWIVNRSYEPLLRGHPDLTETIPFERGSLKRLGFWSGLEDTRRFVADLRRRRFDVVLDLQGLFRSGLMTWITGATRRVGARSAREGATWFYTDHVNGPSRTEGHAVERYWKLTEALGIEGEKTFRFPVFPDEQRWASELLAVSPRPWLFAAVGSRWQTKRWPPQAFRELLGRAQALVGGTVFFVGGGEDVAASLEAARGLPGPARQFAGCTTLPQLVALTSHADAFVANDTGPLHLASALGRPVIAPYTCTKVALTGPFGQLERAIETTVWCAGSLLKRCSRMECLAELTPDRLWPVLREVLCRWESNSRSA